MSRVGKKIILIPDNVEVKESNREVSVSGPRGVITEKIPEEIQLEIQDKTLKISLVQGTKKKIAARLNKRRNSLWGLTRALIFNAVKGVTEGFEKKLEIQGVGFNALLEGENLVLNVGFAHPIRLKIPKELKILIEKNIVTVSGADKELVGQMAANIRKVKPPEPYKGKGIRYLGEKVRRKVGKKAVATAGAPA